MGMLSTAIKGRNLMTTVPMDAGLYASLEAIAKMREIDVNTLIEIQLTGFVRSYERSAVLQPSDPMPYGKYKGYLVEEVIKADPRYVNYLLANSNNFKLDTSSIELLQSLETEETPS